MDAGSILVEIQGGAARNDASLRFAGAIVEILMLSRNDQDEIGIILALAVALHARHNKLLVTRGGREEFLAGWPRLLSAAVDVMMHIEDGEDQ